jgi:hypothetical protein
VCVRVEDQRHLIMKHKLTIKQRLTGARKALAKLERMGTPPGVNECNRDLSTVISITRSTRRC